MNRTKPFLLAAVGVGAWALSEAIYRFAIVPRLPGWNPVPLRWWVVQLSPLVVAVAFAGLVSPTLREAVKSGLCLLVPPVAIASVCGLISVKPVGHDMWANTVAYWLVAITQVGIGVLGVVVTALISRGALAWRHGV